MISARRLLRLFGLNKSLFEKLAKELNLRVGIHVGAHLGQERDLYEHLGFTDILWVEASQGLYKDLTEHLARSLGTTRHVAVNAFASNSEGTQALRHFSNEGASNSMFAATRQLSERWPEVYETGVIEDVAMARLDDIAVKNGFSSPDFLNIDVQGAELLVLQGGTSVLAKAKCVITEVSTEPYYEGGVLFPELSDFMRMNGFEAIQEPPTHGDMIFLRK